jgi:hypothetical protein
VGDQDGSTLDGVAKWVESSGHALELRVARTFRRSGAGSVQQSFGYTDPETGQQREGDIRATYSWRSPLPGIDGRLIVIAECKSSTKHPWVAFYDSGVRIRLGDLTGWAYSSYAPDSRIIEHLHQLWIGMPPFDVPEVASSVAAAHVAESGKNWAGDAIRQVLATTESQRLHYISTQNDEQRAEVTIAAVITSGELVRCMLDGDGQIHMEEADFVVVRVQSYSGQGKRVFVMKEAQVATFAQSLANLANLAHEDAEFRRER